jgi:hypothetical protein
VISVVPVWLVQQGLPDLQDKLDSQDPLVIRVTGGNLDQLDPWVHLDRQDSPD